MITLRLCRIRLPCTRGDSPHWPQCLLCVTMSALHTRGFTSVRPDSVSGEKVCPAHAGIHRFPDGDHCRCGRLPCTRGDSPWRLLVREVAGEVCPAHAGIHLRTIFARFAAPGLPCTRGDSPHFRLAKWRTRSSALHTRGFTRFAQLPPVPNPVCPAHAGIHLTKDHVLGRSVCLPCTRGDSPLYW